jgi:hypothetical protein
VGQGWIAGPALLSSSAIRRFQMANVAARRDPLGRPLGPVMCRAEVALLSILIAFDAMLPVPRQLRGRSGDPGVALA